VKSNLLAIKKRLLEKFPTGVESPQNFNPLTELTLASQLDAIRQALQSNP
jgi:hypothetical protein